jgi:hypothetical protein
MFRLKQFIASLSSASKVESIANPAIPDGVMDCSAIVKNLRHFTKDGRAMDSSQEFSFNELVAGFLFSILGDSPTEEDKDVAIGTQAFVLVMLLRKMKEIKPDFLVEEFLMDTFDQDHVRRLERIFAAMPFQFDEDGQPCPMWGHDPLFTEPIPRTQESDEGFINRRIAPYMDFSCVEAVDSAEASPKISIKPEDLQSELIADPMNGFEEYDDLFYKNQENDENEDSDDDL